MISESHKCIRLQVFESVKENIFKRSEHCEGGEHMEPMQTSPLDEEEVEAGTDGNKSEPSEENKGAVHKTVDSGIDKKWDRYDKQKAKRFEEYHDQQKKIFDDKKAMLHQEYVRNIN